jgi:rhamnogalacturonyl hydrolase YesR
MRRFRVNRWLLWGVLVGALWGGVGGSTADAADPSAPDLRHDEILPLLKKACDWQLSILPTERTGPADSPTGWIRAPFYDGAMALYDVTHDTHYLDAMLAIAQASDWQPGRRTRRYSGLRGDDKLTGPAATQPFLHHADDLAVGQLYTELYFVKHDERMIQPLCTRLDGIMAEPMAGRDDWWWCDSLFMAPPTFAQLGAATGDATYLDFANRQFWDTTDFLYDKAEHLYFRDKSYFSKKERNGQPVFWSRGNGWVLAGIARVLQYMPADYPDRPKYLTLMNQMAERIATLQQPDGFWRVSLLDPDSYAGKETSGTGFYTYAIAWGINNGVLRRDRFLPVVQRAWAALTTVVDPTTGQVGWVQPIGAAPAVVKPENIAEFGTGAFLLAGTQVWKIK